MNQQGMKAANKRRIYRTIQNMPGISRIDIAKQCHFSKTTVSFLVEELIQEKYITDTGLDESMAMSLGRKPTPLVLNEETYGLIVVNRQKHFVQIACVNLTCKVIRLEEHPLEMSETEAVDAAAWTKSFIERECADRKILAVCLILPGLIDEAKNMVSSAVVAEESLNEEITQFRLLFPHIPQVLINDTACWAYAENTFSKESDGEDFAYINMNDGIGAAFVFGGTLLGGVSGMTTQFGHFSLGRGMERCACGGQGCLESRIGEQALQKRIMENNASESFASSASVRFRDVGNAASLGNAGALRVVENMASDLGYALGNLITLLHVKRIVIGGFGRNLGNVFLEKTRASVLDIGYQNFVREAKICYTDLDENALLGGAARYYFDQYLEFD